MKPVQTPHMLNNFEQYREERIKRIEIFLDNLLPAYSSPLFEAMRYSVLNGGKRLRSLLVYATGEALGYSIDLLDAPAAAVELIHCYSLIHDDLPAMDNDDIRRGKPTCHKAFDEATAILAGDALLTLAFQTLSDPDLNPISAENRIQMVQILAEKSGMNGMVGGQAIDMASAGNQSSISLEELRQLHYKKTGALIEASVMLGTIGPLSADEVIIKLQEYARCIGLAFQIQDDILDIVSHSEILGKTSGKDQQQNKATFPSRLGIDKAKQYAATLHQQALEAISFLSTNGHNLAMISDLFINRKH